ncbi:polysaccharide biosynthesis protein [Tersicoccus phoenicis]|uniref:Polysaccharide biosynthesis protein n=1 Tax=Tersicoccus phoenicis TaxID=554083 RepID=A0A1R1L980_9MICC|nr:nucleoside-diphosphate sugar epimerase/dehydratase [Tersicoccus phoenicis]OMH24090.1 polysaccharide biosynthesis protein [Tersicoccus phoenicis]
MAQITTGVGGLPREEKPALWFWIQFALDAGAWLVAIVLALVLRYELTVDAISVPDLVIFAALAIAGQAVVGYIFALYRGRYVFGSFNEARLLVVVTVIVSALLLAATLLFYRSLHVPRSTALIAFPFACLFMAASRYVKRMYVESRAKPGSGAQRTLIYGAGFLGGSLARRMNNDPQSPYRPVGLIDDDPGKKHLRIDSVPVLGRTEDIADAVRRTRAGVLVVAVADLEAKKLREISDHVAGQQVRVLVLPPLRDMLAGGPGIGDFRDVAVEDLIGRHPVDTNVDEIAGYLTGRRVLVTGAGGSIGSELCRQISAFAPAELIMVDRDESALQATQISLTGRGLLDGRDTVLADIRDEEAIGKIFSRRRPEVVFHAAALKHVSLLEQYPGEAWKTNVLGSLNVLRAALEAEVQTFVNISTDKAANPASVLGHSKRMAERMTAWAAHVSGRRFVSVRFGNVIGSRGSMLPLFTEQIRAGGPVTVTDPEVSRFFMTIPEACQLLVQAGAIGVPGDVLILDMGEPVKILDVAQRMIAMSGREVDIVYTGLRHGEKLHEELIGSDEVDEKLHPKISRTAIAELDPERLDYGEWKRRAGMDGNGPETGFISIVPTQQRDARPYEPGYPPAAGQ